MENNRKVRESAAAARLREARGAGNVEGWKVADRATTAAEEAQSRKRQHKQCSDHDDCLESWNLDEGHGSKIDFSQQDQRSSALRHHRVMQESNQDRSAPTQPQGQGQSPHDNSLGTRARRRGEAEAPDQDRVDRRPPQCEMRSSVKLERRSASPPWHGASGAHAHTAERDSRRSKRSEGHANKMFPAHGRREPRPDEGRHHRAGDGTAHAEAPANRSQVDASLRPTAFPPTALKTSS